MNKLQRDAASVSGKPRSRWGGCPLCGSAVSYRGFSSIECLGRPRTERQPHPHPLYPGHTRTVSVPACPNYRAPQPAPPSTAPRAGSLAWARVQRDRGLLVELVSPEGDALVLDPHDPRFDTLRGYETWTWRIAP